MGDDKVTIRIPQQQFEKGKQQKEAAGQTWGEYIADESRGQPTPREIARELAGFVDEEVVARELMQALGEDEFTPVKAACVAAIREELTVQSYGERHD